MNDSMHGRRKRGMTAKEMEKRHEIAEAIHRDNPEMGMEKKMRVATATAMGRVKRR